MTETDTQPDHFATTRIESGITGRAESSHKIYRIAAGVGIAVGGVIIASAIFALGYLVGSQSPDCWGPDAADDAPSWNDEWYDPEPGWGPPPPGPDAHHSASPGSPPASAPPPYSRP